MRHGWRNGTFSSLGAVVTPIFGASVCNRHGHSAPMRREPLTTELRGGGNYRLVPILCPTLLSTQHQLLRSSNRWLGFHGE
ncbi:hypothetical protein GGR56DRAFT_617461 [Xylariaceae sp. FL0804]|nr:hypothetical protein GGR56DRAFT_617461 [Xylariaceae sp. FL0804]